MSNALILVSHSYAVGQAIKDLVQELVPNPEKAYHIYTACGTEDQAIGTSPMLVLDQIQASADHDQIYLIYDMGSAKMSLEAALDFVDDPDLKAKIQVIDQAAILEGTYVAAVQSTIQASADDLVQAVKQALDY